MTAGRDDDEIVGGDDSDLEDGAREGHGAFHHSARRARDGVRQGFFWREDGVEREMNPRQLPDFLDVLAHGIVGVAAGTRSRVTQQGVIGVDGGAPSQPDRGALGSAGKALELMRLDVAHDEAQFRCDKMPIHPDGGAALRLSQVTQIGLVIAVVGAHGIARYDGSRQHALELFRCQGSVSAGGNQQGDRRRRQSQRLQARQQRGEQQVMGHRTGLVIDGDGRGARAPKILQPHAADGGRERRYDGACGVVRRGDRRRRDPVCLPGWGQLQLQVALAVRQAEFHARASLRPACPSSSACSRAA